MQMVSHGFLHPPQLRKMASTAFLMAQIQSLPVTASDVQRATRCDRILSKVYQYVRYGWPKEVDKEPEPYKFEQE